MESAISQKNSKLIKKDDNKLMAKINDSISDSTDELTISCQEKGI